MAGKLPAHETKAVSSSVVTPATTAATLAAHGSAYVMMSSTTADVRFTVDGQTDPVATGGSEVGTLLPASTTIVLLTIEEFLNLRMLRNASTDARVQFEFLAESRRQSTAG